MQKRKRKINFFSCLQKAKSFLPLQPDQKERVLKQVRLLNKTSKKGLALRNKMPNFGSPTKSKDRRSRRLEKMESLGTKRAAAGVNTPVLF